jgi:hypothetical protein
MLAAQCAESLGIRAKFPNVPFSVPAQPTIALGTGLAPLAYNLDVTRPSALVPAQAIGQIEPLQHFFKAAGRFGIGVQYRAYIGSRHIEVTEDIVKEPGAIETVDFGAEVAASFLIGGPMSNSTTDGDKAMSKTSCADRYHLRVHTGLLPRIFLLSSRARSAH